MLLLAAVILRGRRRQSFPGGVVMWFTALREDSQR
jgi:hypothetical protein